MKSNSQIKAAYHANVVCYTDLDNNLLAISRPSMIPEAFTAMVDAVRLWGERKNESAEARQNREEALRLMMDTVVATKAYLYELNQGHEPSRSQERELSHKWQHAAMDISEYDHELYLSAQLKALGWAYPREWKRAEMRPWTIKLDVIIEQCQWLQENG
jgi:hypothetical protein